MVLLLNKKTLGQSETISSPSVPHPDGSGL